MDRAGRTQLQGTGHNAATNALLESLNDGPLSFGQLLSAQREAEEANVSQFAAKLGISRQHLHQLENGQKRVSPARAVYFARLLGQSETFYLQLALQDLANDSGIGKPIEIRVA
ncbi:MAG TPA: helix-turn-helix transcriptional regulator [Thermoanaerobaculia bacterium]|jgi:plasmid maintenance system antidote protein VapI|nr:helix-turn-helix transcriptional regulator [Thermoanaerobaculia bacterium]